jgi:hypothetical protein
MNLKRIFGALLTGLGIIGLIYAAILFVNNSDSPLALKALIIYGVIGLVFLLAGISLIRTTRDDS